MHIAQVHIKNFRLFDDLSLSLGPGLNLIVGENNSGKTSLVDAIRYTLETNSSEWVKIQESDFRRGQSRFSIQLKFEAITVRQARVFVEHITHEEVLEKRERCSALYVTLTAELTDHVARGVRYIRTELRSGRNGTGPTIEREVRAYLSATYLRPLRDAESELTASRGSRLSQVLHSSKSLREATNVIGLLTALINANKSILGNQAIKKSLNQIQQQIRSISFANSTFRPAIEIVGGTDINRLSEAERKQMCRAILEKLQLLIDEEDRQQGLGYSNLLFMATELLLLEQEQDDFPFLLIEEPEAHLHPQLQMKFLKALRDDFGQLGMPSLQSILTTHSPNLASKAPLESVIIMARGQAFPLRPTDTALDSDDYVFLEKFLDVTKSNLFFARAVLIVEGDAENILLPTIAELLGKPLEDYGVSIVNVGSTAYARYAKIFQRKDSRRWIPIRVMCVRDLDLWPRRAEFRGDGDTIGFKKAIPKKANGKGGNEDCWIDFYDTKALQDFKDLRRKIRGQNVEVELSARWTFEYCLALGSLFALLYEAVNGSNEDIDTLPTDPEERAIYLYGLIESPSRKTEVAYRLVSLLRKTFTPARSAPLPNEDATASEEREQAFQARAAQLQQELRDKLPCYIVRAIDYVTNNAEAPMLPPTAEAVQC
ncbi:AAA family ATPase [Paludibaculum fermentans]|uniref:AAA family ATPase n=2 Tax=Paludibaculum fermentans TaxID=1473598 RepID=A0A7S7NYT2_PALFE|nr:AAA family ATPase [Paludibaculum fermentans]